MIASCARSEEIEAEDPGMTGDLRDATQGPTCAAPIRPDPPRVRLGSASVHPVHPGELAGLRGRGPSVKCMHGAITRAERFAIGGITHLRIFCC
jgi:hypothetical protein